MTARYLQTAFQKDLLDAIGHIDRSSPAFHAVAPFVIDCRDDRAGFDAATTETLRAILVARFERGELSLVSSLPPTAKAYAIAKVRQRYRELDAETRTVVTAILDDWRRGKDIYVGYGIDIILPLGDMRLHFDLGALVSL